MYQYLHVMSLKEKYKEKKYIYNIKMLNNERRQDNHNNQNTDTITYTTMKRNTLPGKKITTG